MLVVNVPPLALSVCIVGRRARWRAPEEGTQKKSLDAAVA
jgi:hypothetical protein